MDDLSWQQVLIGACIAFIVWVVIFLALEAKDKRERRVPPPSRHCQRNKPGAVP